MKKVKFLVVTSLMVVSSILGFSGCEKKLRMDEEKCAEVALEYLENKYQTEFELSEAFTYRKGKEIVYTKVILINKYKDIENEYAVIIYPENFIDKDDDGYYDSYKVISDTYMCYLIQDYTKKEIDKLLSEAEVTRFISSISIEEVEYVDGFLGFSTNFVLPSEEKFSLKDILENHKISIHCWLKISETDNDDMIQSKITDIIKPLISSDDLIIFSIDVYDDETYKEIEELREKNMGYNSKGNERISFSIEKVED